MLLYNPLAPSRPQSTPVANIHLHVHTVVLLRLSLGVDVGAQVEHHVARLQLLDAAHANGQSVQLVAVGGVRVGVGATATLNNKP